MHGQQKGGTTTDCCPSNRHDSRWSRGPTWDEQQRTGGQNGRRTRNAQRRKPRVLKAEENSEARVEQGIQDETHPDPSPSGSRVGEGQTGPCDPPDYKKCGLEEEEDAECYRGRVNLTKVAKMVDGAGPRPMDCKNSGERATASCALLQDPEHREKRNDPQEDSNRPPCAIVRSEDIQEVRAGERKLHVRGPRSGEHFVREESRCPRPCRAVGRATGPGTG